MAEQLVAAMTGEFDPAELPRRVPRGADGGHRGQGRRRQEIAEPAPAAPAKLGDLMAALEASVAAAEGRSNRETEEAAEEEVDQELAGGRDAGAGHGGAARPAAKHPKKVAVPVEEIEEREVPARKVARRKTA